MSLLGAKVRDKVTGIEGIVTTLAEHLTGCSRAWVEPRVNEKGETPGLWVDVSRLEVLIENAVTLEAEVVAAAPSPSDCGDPNAR